MTTGQSFAGSPLSSRGTTVCAGGEVLQVFTFDANSDRDSSMASIDRHDPSHIGSTIVEWLGTPRFWSTDRAIVLYAGDDLSTVSLLSTALGQPFAEGDGMGRGPGTDGCP